MDKRFKWHPWEHKEAEWRALVLTRIDRRAGSDSCWPWCGNVNQGYGNIYDPVSRRTVQAHRVVWELFGLDLPPGETLEHTCGNPGCVNPRHLEPITL